MSLIPELPHFSNGLKSLDSSFVLKISKIILKKYPCDAHSLFEDGMEHVASSLSLSVTELESLIKELIGLWKYLIYHQKKQNEFYEILQNAGIDEELLPSFYDLWVQDAFETSTRLAQLTSSGLPFVQDIHCTTQMNLASASRNIRSPEIVVNLETTSGKKKLVLSREKAIQLYYEANKIQTEVDKLLEENA